MTIKLARVLTALIIAVLPATVVAEDWIEVASTDINLYYIKPGSLEITTNTSSTRIALVIGKILHQKTNSVTLEKWYVPLTHCEAEQGRLSTTNIDGSFKRSYEFVFGAGTAGSTIAEMICGASKTRAEPSKWGT